MQTQLLLEREAQALNNQHIDASGEIQDIQKQLDLVIRMQEEFNGLLGEQDPHVERIADQVESAKEKLVAAVDEKAKHEKSRANRHRGRGLGVGTALVGAGVLVGVLGGPPVAAVLVGAGGLVTGTTGVVISRRARHNVAEEHKLFHERLEEAEGGKRKQRQLEEAQAKFATAGERKVAERFPGEEDFLAAQPPDSPRTMRAKRLEERQKRRQRREEPLFENEVKQGHSDDGEEGSGSRRGSGETLGGGSHWTRRQYTARTMLLDEQEDSDNESKTQRPQRRRGGPRAVSRDDDDEDNRARVPQTEDERLYGVSGEQLAPVLQRAHQLRGTTQAGSVMVDTQSEKLNPVMRDLNIQKDALITVDRMHRASSFFGAIINFFTSRPKAQPLAAPAPKQTKSAYVHDEKDTAEPDEGLDNVLYTLEAVKQAVKEQGSGVREQNLTLEEAAQLMERNQVHLRKQIKRTERGH